MLIDCFSSIGRNHINVSNFYAGWPCGRIIATVPTSAPVMLASTLHRRLGRVRLTKGRYLCERRDGPRLPRAGLDLRAPQ